MTSYLLLAPLLLIPAFLIGRHDRNIDRAILLMLVIAFGLFSGIRGNSDNDYLAYVSIFEIVPTLESFSFKSVEGMHGEIGYLFYNSLLKSIGADVGVLFFTFAILSLSLKASFYNKFLKYPSAALALYLAESFIVTEFIQIRWALGISLLSVAAYLVYVNRKYAAVFIIILAALIQSLAIVGLLLIFFNLTRVSTRHWYIIIAIGIGLGLAPNLSAILLGLIGYVEDAGGAGYVTNKSIGYIVNNERSLGLILQFKLGLMVIYALYFRKKAKISRVLDYLIGVFLLFATLVFITSQLSTLSGRLYVLAVFFAIPVYIGSLSMVKNLADSRLLLLAGSTYAVGYYIFTVIANYNAQYIREYTIGL